MPSPRGPGSVKRPLSSALADRLRRTEAEEVVIGGVRNGNGRAERERGSTIGTRHGVSPALDSALKSQKK